MKQRFSSLDVKAISNELSQALVGLRLANLYDIKPKKFLFKFSTSERKEQLILESGFRAHLTDFARPTAAAPSAFTSRLRKILKTRRCTAVSQIGTDRIIDLEFSDSAYHLFLEFFAAGNVILTDADLKILAILRPVYEGQGPEPQRTGLTYNVEHRQNYRRVLPFTRHRVRDALERSVAHAETAVASKKKKSKSKAGDELRRGLAAAIDELPPVVVDHAFEATGFEPTTKPADILDNEALFDALFTSLEEARRIMDEVTGTAICKGYIVAKEQEPSLSDSTSAQRENPRRTIYEEFQPFSPRKFSNDKNYSILKFDNFNKAVDEFFSSVEGQKVESRLNDREAAAQKKLEVVREIQTQKVDSLKQAQLVNMRKAGALEANVDRVQEAMDAVNALIGQGMDWGTIGKLIERERKKKNPVAQIIKLPLDLERDTITLLLAEKEEQQEFLDEACESTSADGSDDEKGDDHQRLEKKLSVEIKLTLSPYANAREYYDQRRTATIKEQKTVEQSATALKNAERKIADDLRKSLKLQEPPMQPLRHPMWFEKFLWFISSDGYLVLGGRDGMQNELLYMSYLRRGDVYVHADVRGAASVIVKNIPEAPDAPIPPSTLSQAGTLSVCSSTAWDSKAGMGAWWVNAEQVSKSDPAGEYLPLGSFSVQGDKNFLLPQPLILGFGFIFKISEESKANHTRHRLFEEDCMATDKLGGGPASNPQDPQVIWPVCDGGMARDEVHEPGKTQPEQDSEVFSGDSSDESPGPEGQKPLQVCGINEAGEDEENVDFDHDHDMDHVKDRLKDINFMGPAEMLLMSGALDAPGPEQKEGLAEFAGSAEDIEAKSEIGPVRDARLEAVTEALMEPVPPPTVTVSHPASNSQHKKAPAKRGQRGRQRRIATKYEGQDEEDRAIHEELIGAAKGREKTTAEARVKAERLAEADARRERRLQAQEKRRQKVAKYEETRRLTMNKEADEVSSKELAAATLLDNLVGTLLPGDEILDIVPMCAPWAAMAKCKYRAKIQPGATKKGKAVQGLLARWLADMNRKGSIDENSRDSDKMWPREVELIKAVKPEEVNNVVPVGKLTVMTAGGTGRAKSGGKPGKGGKGSANMGMEKGGRKG